MLAVLHGHTDTVKVLLEAGASIEAKDRVSKRISITISTCVCVRVCVYAIFLHDSV